MGGDPFAGRRCWSPWPWGGLARARSLPGVDSSRSRPIVLADRGSCFVCLVPSAPIAPCTVHPSAPWRGRDGLDGLRTATWTELLNGGPPPPLLPRAKRPCLKLPRAVQASRPWQTRSWGFIETVCLGCLGCLALPYGGAPSAAAAAAAAARVCVCGVWCVLALLSQLFCYWAGIVQVHCPPLPHSHTPKPQCLLRRCSDICAAAAAAAAGGGRAHACGCGRPIDEARGTRPVSRRCPPQE